VKVYLAKYCSMTFCCERVWTVIGVCQSKDLAYDLIKKHEELYFEDKQKLALSRWVVTEYNIIENEEHISSVIEGLKE
jgi:hypothetical protein